VLIVCSLVIRIFIMLSRQLTQILRLFLENKFFSWINNFYILLCKKEYFILLAQIHTFRADNVRIWDTVSSKQSCINKLSFALNSHDDTTFSADRFNVSRKKVVRNPQFFCRFQALWRLTRRYGLSEQLGRHANGP
jgi:hypothetical protein